MRKYLILFFFLFSQPAVPNVGGSDLQNFNPNTSGLGFVTVRPSETLEPLMLNVGGFLTYTTNSLSYSTVSGAPNNQKFSEPTDRLLYSNFQFGLGLIKGWEVGLAAGFINAQDIDQSNFLFSYGDTGVNDVMLNTKVRIINTQAWGVAIIAGADFDQIKNNPFAGDDAGPSFNFEAVVDLWLSEKILWAVNLGYRLRMAGQAIPNTGVTPMPDQVIYSSAVAYHLDDQGSAVIAELYGSYPMDIFTLPTDRQISNLELLLGYRWRAHKNFDLTGGLGTEAYHGLGSPDVRAFLGVNFRHGFLQNSSARVRQTPEIVEHPGLVEASDADGDGVPDPIDQCPDTWAQNYVDEKGCSTRKTPSALDSQDRDGDGVSDSMDRCLQTPPGARVNGFGCEIKQYQSP